MKYMQEPEVNQTTTECPQPDTARSGLCPAGAQQQTGVGEQQSSRPSLRAGPGNESMAESRGQPQTPRKGLSNNAINFIVDSILLAAFLFVLCAAAIVQFVFPGAAASNGVALWGYGLDGWIRILTGSLAVFGLLVLLHLILHWSWVCSFVSSRLSKALNRRITVTESAKTLWGVGTLIVVLTIMGAVVAAAEFCIVVPK